ncbi:NAD-dependent epimerase/dehydratase family protein [Desulforhopalus singaporensis]|uniref:dTDP-4-dehydrorhamnose reductase n=1 Tax=Desulforhopalus singaporensis TaxID=91360 RepID=A0A1H0JY15_9BACT|nr:NAD(P)-dependent oxidoreductase [Desulforhopalus singaporensis]SDO48373.1 Nucleoside-diphosphate-sugar epimerase [Desulforhopalus singaporensis]
MNKKVGVVIGGSGLIGGTIVNYYKTVHADTIDIRAPSSKKLSLREEDDIRRYMIEVNPHFIINAAMANLGSDGQLAYEVNYRGPVNLARAAAGLGVPLIHMTSAATLPPGKNLTEQDTLSLRPNLSNYAKSKLMAEKSLHLMARTGSLDYSCVRLAIVYGAHDHKIQGFHRLLFSVADESMPVLFTKKNTLHSYTNAKKLPYLVHHMLEHREEFSGQTFNFVDRQPVDLSALILEIKSFLNLNLPKKIYVPFWFATSGKKTLEIMLRLFRRVGLKANLPPELIFLDSFYKSQTLSITKLEKSSFVDPYPWETIHTMLPELIYYYLSRWTRENLITTYKDKLDHEKSVEDIFDQDPQRLLDLVHAQGLNAYSDLSEN